MTNTPNMKPGSDSSSQAAHEKPATGSPQADTQKHDAQNHDAPKLDAQKADHGQSQAEPKPAHKN